MDESRLSDVKSRLRYSFLMQLDSPKSAAESLAFMLSLEPDLEVVDRYFEAVGQVTPEMMSRTASRYFRPEGRSIVTLAHEKHKEKGDRP